MQVSPEFRIAAAEGVRTVIHSFVHRLSTGFSQYDHGMVYPVGHVLLRFHGHFGTLTGFSDRWSVGLRFGGPVVEPGYDAAKLQTFVNAAQTAGNVLHAATGSATGTSCFLDYVSGAQIGVLGKYSPANQLTVISPTTSTTGSGTPTMPWNTAHVISLRTATPRGPGSNGRVYWPCLAPTMNTPTGRLVTASTATRLALFKTFFDALNVAAGTYAAGGARLIVASAIGAGRHATVTSIRADDRLDTIERRENDLPPVWSTSALA